MTDAAMAGTATAEDRAEHVEISQAGVQFIDAQTVAISQGGAAQVRANEVTVSQGGIALARAGHIELRNGSSAFALVADKANVDGSSNVLLLISSETSGEVRPLLDLPSALAIGIGFGVALSVLRRLL
jgi:hypothetical protein